MKMNQKINFSIRKGLVEESLLCPELLLYFVIDGSANIRISQNDYQLGQEDCIIVNSGNVHSVTSTSDTLIAVVSISAALFLETAKDHKNLFLFQSNFQKNSTYFEMVHILRRLVYTDIHSDNLTNCRLLSLLFELTHFLVEHYLLDTQKNAAVQSNDDLRITQLMQYVNQNYKESISLATVADELFVSKSTLSRLFKKHTGIYFADYVNQVRVRSSVQELLHTDKSITRIAMDNGFSNPSTFHRVFSNYYHLSPSDFKKEQKESIATVESRNKLLKEQLRAEMQDEKYKVDEYTAIETVNTTVDVRNGTPFHNIWNKAINMGAVHDLTRANMQKQALYLAENLGYRYIRMWNIFTTQMMITYGTPDSDFNYENLDVVLDFLFYNKLYPFLDFGKRPTTALYSEGSPVYYSEDCVDFQSLDNWKDALVSLINHVITRYGIENVKKWRFELSLDPSNRDPFACYQSDFSYVNMYRIFNDVFREMVPDAMIGGAMFIPGFEEDKISSFLHYCTYTKCIPDFVSCLLFPYETHVDHGNQTYEYYRTMTSDYELNTIRKLHQVIKDIAPDILIYLDECNNTLSNRNYLNDSSFRATYFVKVISELEPYVDLFCPWTGSDWVSNYYDTRAIINGGSGLLTKDNIRKPAYYAINFLNSLGETLLERGSNYIITSKGGHSYYILCFNYKEYNSNYYLQRENMNNPDDVVKLFQDENPVEVKFTLEGLPDNKNYIIKKRTINPQDGSILDKWKNFEYIQDLSANDVNYLRECCIPSLSAATVISENGKLPVKLILQNQEISLLHIYQSV